MNLHERLKLQKSLQAVPIGNAYHESVMNYPSITTSQNRTLNRSPQKLLSNKTSTNNSILQKMMGNLLNLKETPQYNSVDMNRRRRSNILSTHSTSNQRSEDRIRVYDVFHENQKVSQFPDYQFKRSSLPQLSKKRSPSLNESKQLEVRVPENTERILDLLLLNTCDLKKVFQKPEKKRRKIVAQGRIPQDFFNILSQF